ncbi:hypothetical protein L6R29_21630 [Myxococcota bacterium]|nr:hypothetical protein [Myxococcota bacterium]
MSKTKTRKENALDVLGELQKNIHQRGQNISKALESLQPKRGGQREGAGRPLIGEAPTSERVIFRLTKEQLKLLEQKTEDGESPNQAARRMLLELLSEEK